DRLLRIVELQKSVNQSAGETVASANSIQNLHVLAIRRFIKFPARPTNHPPIISIRRLYRAKRRSRDLKIWISLHGLLNDAFKRRDIDLGEMLIRSLNLETEARGKILFVANHYIHIFRNFSVHFLSALLAADAFPKGWPIIQVVRHNRAMLAGSLNRFQ